VAAKRRNAMFGTEIRRVNFPSVTGILMVLFIWLAVSRSIANCGGLEPTIVRMSSTLIANAASKNTWQ